MNINKDLKEIKRKLDKLLEKQKMEKKELRLKLRMKDNYNPLTNPVLRKDDAVSRIDGDIHIQQDTARLSLATNDKGTKKAAEFKCKLNDAFTLADI